MIVTLTYRDSLYVLGVYASLPTCIYHYIYAFIVSDPIRSDCMIETEKIRHLVSGQLLGLNPKSTTPPPYKNTEAGVRVSGLFLFRASGGQKI